MGLTDKLDQPLMRALRGGAAALPEDIERLTAYMRLIQQLLGEKAVECEPTWAQTCASAAEIGTLQDLEAAVIERAIGLRLNDLDAVLIKFGLWRTLVDDDQNGLRDRLVLSLEADLRAIARRSCRPT